MLESTYDGIYKRQSLHTIDFTYTIPSFLLAIFSIVYSTKVLVYTKMLDIISYHVFSLC